jgi:hypothetical protein
MYDYGSPILGLAASAAAIQTLDARIAYHEKIAKMSKNKALAKTHAMLATRLRREKALIARVKSGVATRVGVFQSNKTDRPRRMTSSRPAPPSTYPAGFSPTMGTQVAPSPNVDMTALSLPQAAQLAPEMPPEVALTPADASASIESASMWSNPVTWVVGAAVIGGIVWASSRRGKKKGGHGAGGHSASGV